MEKAYKLKVILFLLTFNVLVFGSYKQAFTYYIYKQYEKAILEAKSSTSEYSNPKLHLIWAKSAQALHLTNDAIAAYERVAILDEKNIEAKLKLLELYVQTSRTELAEELYRELEQTKLSPREEKLLHMIYKVDLSSLKSRASFAIGYDTNINVSPGSSALDDYLQSTGSEGEKTTLFGRFNGGINYHNDLKEKGTWFVKSHFNIYAQNNIDAHFYDLYVGTLGFSPGYKGKKYTISTALNYNRIYYLEKDFLQELSFSPRYSILLNTKTIAKLDLKYKKRNYIQKEDQDRDDSSLTGSIGIVYLFKKNYIYLNSTFESYTPDTPHTLSYLDKDIFTLNFILNYVWTPHIKTKLLYKYRQTYYEDKAIVNTTTISNTKRSDTYNRIGITLTYNMTKHSDFFFSNNYIVNSSNYVLAEYTKNVTMFGINLKY